MFAAPGPSEAPISPQLGDLPCGRRPPLALTDDPLSDAWPRIRAELRRAVSESTWHSWIEPVQPGSLGGGELLLEAPDAIRPWIASNFSKLLQAATDVVLGTGAATVRLVAP